MKTAVYTPQSILKRITGTLTCIFLKLSVHYERPYIRSLDFMFPFGTDYKLAKKLMSMSDLEIITIKNKDNLHKAYQKSSERYNKEDRVIKWKPGQEVYRRNVVLTDFSKNRNFLKCRIVRPIGENMFELGTITVNPLAYIM